MNGPSFDAKFWGGAGGSLRYDLGTVVMVKVRGGGPPPADWNRKSKLQEAFGDFGHIIRIETHGKGVAYVEYDDKRDAEDMVRDMNGKKVCGCVVDAAITTGAGGSSSLGGGKLNVSERVLAIAEKYRLDDSATGQLTRVFQERSRLASCAIEEDFALFEEHLAASNKPSALVCKMLGDIRSGRAIERCRFTQRRDSHDDNGSSRRGRDSHDGDRRYRGRDSNSDDRRYRGRSRSRSHARDRRR
eukprot:TRINITY_DN14384_c0_g1_i1.p1 TRINITY_DN14384_c0_g1~~TRINITY_DN14384_c0_g1_i1.p1  ORF type:complete len:244 (-),score=44.01 TRINITY_DN14384_c0_g1_i1:4-735(-)